MLFSPVLAFVYLVLFSLPRTITHFFAFIVFFFCFVFILNKQELRIPLSALFALSFAVYIFSLTLVLETDKQLKGEEIKGEKK